jgi:hypothetical protein
MRSLVLVLSLTAPLAFSQSNDRDSRVTPQTIAGCLSKGTDPGQFVIVKEGKERIVVKAVDDLSVYVGKQVQVVATKEMKGGVPILNVTKVEVVADTCAVAASLP